ncbi:MAG: hypothetical protein KA792_05490, partial [Bacteroidales bacterium]|nr:hypothetical protein [Bacteroidales bacterium]
QVHNQEPVEQIIETAEYNEENQVPIPVVEEKPETPKNVISFEESMNPVTVLKTNEKEIENQSKVKPSADNDLFSKTEQITLSDKLDDKKPSLNEMISQQKTDKSIADKIHRASDIKDLIGINEKYLFINNLFNGDMQVYNSFIDSLNKASDNSLALNIINSAKDLHKWKEDSEAYLKLVDIVSTKFYM